MSYERFKWTDVKTAQLKDLWEQGVPTAQIQRDIGAPSRGSVLGKVHRLGLTNRNEEIRRRAKERAAAQSERRKQVGQARAQAASAPRPPTVTPPAPIVPADFPARCTVFALTDDRGCDLGHCRWPIGSPGTPGFFFCGRFGANLSEKRPYCKAHMRLAYNRSAAA